MEIIWNGKNEGLGLLPLKAQLILKNFFSETVEESKRCKGDL